MDTSRLAHKAAHARGFTLLEVLISLVILSVGVAALAVVLRQMGTSGDQTRYISTAAVLASDKLEDFNRYPSGDPNITVSSGTTAGSLTTDTAGYSDQVLLSSGAGVSTAGSGSMFTSAGYVSEVVSSVSGGTTIYTTISQTPTGVPPAYPLPTSTTAPTIGADTLQFKRRWLIEANTPINGVNRFTVLVTLQNYTWAGSGGTVSSPTVSFQMSMVRGQ
jgi:prepilin-type N-terminal cleavage/methylation domain-containing protein